VDFDPVFVVAVFVFEAPVVVGEEFGDDGSGVGGRGEQEREESRKQLHGG